MPTLAFVKQAYCVDRRQSNLVCTDAGDLEEGGASLSVAYDIDGVGMSRNGTNMLYVVLSVMGLVGVLYFFRSKYDVRTDAGRSKKSVEWITKAV
mgnify:CR=1 FL=1